MTRHGLRLGMLIGIIYLCFAASAGAWDKPLWVRQLVTAKLDEAVGVATDAAGSVYLAGKSSYFIGYDGYGDAWLAKYSTDGRLLWKRQFEPENEWVTAAGLATDTMGSVYFAGTTGGQGGGLNSGPGDAWVAKYNAAGHILWKRYLIAESDDYASAIATDKQGNVYLSVNSYGSPGTFHWVVKYNSAGRMLWKRYRYSFCYELTNGSAADARGNIYETGITDESPDGNGCSANFSAWVGKYSASGDPLWRRQLETAEEYLMSRASDVATDPEGSVYVTGITDGSIGGPNRGSIDAWLVKYDPAGAVLWKQQIGTDQVDNANGVASDAEGNVYVTGSANESGGWVAKYAAEGRMLWKRQLGIPVDGRDVATDRFGSLYVAGATWCSRSDADVWLAEYSTRR